MEEHVKLSLQSNSLPSHTNNKKDRKKDEEIINLLALNHSIINVDKWYNLSISPSPVYSLFYISFMKQVKSETCKVLADDTCYSSSLLS